MQNSLTALRENPASQEVNRTAERQNEGFRTAAGRSSRLRELSAHEVESQEKRIRRILVPIDFSPASAQAVERAVALANQCEATLTILHVLDINAQAAPGASGNARDFMERLWGDGAAQMGRLAWSLSGRVEAQTRLEEGLPWEEIVEASRVFDLVILGKGKSRTGWKLFSQHTAERVIENAACPVMVVKDRNYTFF